jgi:hypothetical protein
VSDGDSNPNSFDCKANERSGRMSPGVVSARSASRPSRPESLAPFWPPQRSSQRIKPQPKWRISRHFRIGETGFEPATARPQPEGLGAPQSGAPISTGISVCGLLSVSLSLFPALFPAGANASLTIATSRSDGA